MDIQEKSSNTKTATIITADPLNPLMKTCWIIVGILAIISIIGSLNEHNLRLLILPVIFTIPLMAFEIIISGMAVSVSEDAIRWRGDYLSGWSKPLTYDEIVEVFYLPKVYAGRATFPSSLNIINRTMKNTYYPAPDSNGQRLKNLKLTPLNFKGDELLRTLAPHLLKHPKIITDRDPNYHTKAIL
jgi:hypothetical protein